MAPRAPKDELEVDEGGPLASLADGLSGRLVDLGIDGVGPIDGAREVADAALATAPDRDAAVKELVADHLKLAAANGFVTNLGGFATMAAALPANLVGFYALATRLSAAIAHVHGHDLDDEVVRATVLVTLTRDDAGDLLSKAGSIPGVKTSSLPMRAVLRQMPASAVGVVNKGVAFSLLSSVVGKGAARLGRFVPFVGGAVGAGLDVLLMRQIANTAKEEFSAVEPAWYAS